MFPRIIEMIFLSVHELAIMYFVVYLFSSKFSSLPLYLFDLDDFFIFPFFLH
jgi:hypothetical protein